MYNHNRVPIVPCYITLKIAARLACPNWVRAPSYPKLRCGYETTVGSVYTIAAASQLSLRDPLMENVMYTQALNHTLMKGKKINTPTASNSYLGNKPHDY